jgi:hypothetical protein
MAKKAQSIPDSDEKQPGDRVEMEMMIDLGELVGFAVQSKGNKKTGGTWTQATLRVNPTSPELIEVVKKVAQQEKLIVSVRTLQQKMM